ncbi:MAG: methyltransferase [Acetobacteraceae bacterium]
MTKATPDPQRIMQVGMGFFASKTLLSAVELGLFSVLGAGPLTGEALRTRLGLHTRAAADFFDALVALGFLARDGDGPEARYANTPETAAFLDQSSPTYLGGILAMASQRLYPYWSNLTEALQTGRQQNESKDGGDPFTALYTDPARLVQFLAAMAGVQQLNFTTLAALFDFRRFRVICDVGGASAAQSLAIAERHPNISCISYDLPQVTPHARRRIEAAGLAHRIEALSGNFLTDALPQADIILMGNVLHDWGTTTKELLIAKAHAAVADGGALIAVENIIDDARRENAMGLLMSLNMLIETPEGYDYTFAQFDGWCRAAGFRSTEKIPLAGAASAAVAWK